MRQNLSIFVPLGENKNVKARTDGASLDRVIKRNAKETRVVAMPKVDYLNLSYFRKPGVKVTASNNKSGKSYVVTFAKAIMPRDEFLNTLRNYNTDVDFYDADIDENELINMTEEPLWVVCRKGNSYVIKRNN